MIERDSADGSALIDPIFIQVTKRLRQITHELNTHSKFLQEHFGITIPQLITLREIYEHGPLSFSELTKILTLNNSTVTGIVDRLEKHNLVQRTRTSRDRRRIDVVITREGTEFLTNAPPPIQPGFIQGLEDMSREEVEKVLWAADTILELLRRPVKGTPENTGSGKWE
jgi:MarR family transcriptional regulator, organic hydroperoxide resistance regulator